MQYRISEHGAHLHSRSQAALSCPCITFQVLRHHSIRDCSSPSRLLLLLRDGSSFVFNVISSLPRKYDSVRIRWRCPEQCVFSYLLNVLSDSCCHAQPIADCNSMLLIRETLNFAVRLNLMSAPLVVGYMEMIQWESVCSLKGWVELSRIIGVWCRNHWNVTTAAAGVAETFCFTANRYVFI